MNSLDREHLLEVKAWAEKEIERIEIHRANEPMFKGFRDSSETLVSKTIPDLMAGPEAEVRRSVLALEESLWNSDERYAKADADRSRRLDRAKARTNALREWLEGLS